MTERSGLVTVGGNPVTLVGDELNVGDPAPDGTLIGNDMKPVDLSHFKGKIVVLSFVGSLDTTTCDVETRRFNQEATTLGDQVVILTVSMDLPFAQARWCGAAGVENVTTLSDYRNRDVGKKYGVYVKETALTARAIYVIDPEGIIRYIQLVPEVGNEPNYEEVIENVKKLVS
jgi:thiol peroxidase